MATPEENISIVCTSEYKDYSYNAQHDIWTLVTLKAPYHEEEEGGKRQPIDIVAVMDKSGSMAGEKLRLVKKTLEFMLTQLNEKDQLALVTYDTNVYVDFAFMKMTKDNKTTALANITAIRDGSSTNLSGGLMKGLTQVIDRPADGKNDVASVLLLTDGLANHGITVAEGIVAAMKDPKSFDGPSAGSTRSARPPQTKQMAKKRAGPPPPPPPPQVDSPKNSQGPSEPKPAEGSVYTFGFGEDHCEDLLKKISDAGGGMYYFIETEDKIGESFADCLGGLMGTVAQCIQMQIDVESGVAIKDVHSAGPSDKEGDLSVKISMGDLQSEESRDVVLELSIPPVNDPYEETPYPVLNVKIDYYNVVTKNTEKAKGSLGVLRPESESAHNEEDISPIVTKEKCRVSMTKAMNEANKKADAGDYAAAKVLLSGQIDKMKKCKEVVTKYHNNPELEEVFDGMAADLAECEINTDSKVWKQKGKKKHINKMQMYTQQRCSEADSNVFKTNMKKKMVAKSKAYFQEEEE